MNYSDHWTITTAFNQVSLTYQDLSTPGLRQWGVCGLPGHDGRIPRRRRCPRRCRWCCEVGGTQRVGSRPIEAGIERWRSKKSCPQLIERKMRQFNFKKYSTRSLFNSHFYSSSVPSPDNCFIKWQTQSQLFSSDAFAASVRERGGERMQPSFCDAMLRAEQQLGLKNVSSCR